ncbi:unnamed protein product, partial [Scytosiphon promiscuus]
HHHFPILVYPAAEPGSTVLCHTRVEFAGGAGDAGSSLLPWRDGACSFSKRPVGCWVVVLAKRPPSRSSCCCTRRVLPSSGPALCARTFGHGGEKRTIATRRLSQPFRIYDACYLGWCLQAWCSLPHVRRPKQQGEISGAPPPWRSGHDMESLSGH